MGLSLLSIAHHLWMVRYLSDRMVVMCLASLVEIGKADEVYFDPRHPCTDVLIGSKPELDHSLCSSSRTILVNVRISVLPVPMRGNSGTMTYFFGSAK